MSLIKTLKRNLVEKVNGSVRIVDLKAVHQRSVTVTNIPESRTSSVVQMTFDHILNLCLHVGEHDRSVSQVAWTTASARERLMRIAVENVQAFFADNPQSVVS